MDLEVENTQPLLENGASQEGIQAPVKNPTTSPQKPPKTTTQKAVRKTFKGTAHLVKLLPTGSVLTFQLLSPILAHQGQCNTYASQYFTLAMVFVCVVFCFIQSFTDSFRDERGKVRYGMATFSGLWVIDGTVKLSEKEKEKYKLRFIDFFHAFMSVLVFVGVALFDKNVVNCFISEPSEEVEELLTTLPVAIGTVTSVLFLKFPTTRQGVGTPLSRN